MRLAKQQAFREAIDKFQRSYGFLEKYPWLDKYRFITMLDSSARSYREMALCNIAYSNSSALSPPVTSNSSASTPRE